MKRDPLVVDRVCDFCSGPPAWCYPCDSFMASAMPARSDGDWLACDRCHRLIEADAREELARRCLGMPAVQKHVGVRVFVRTQFG
jgi:hypothetical protein